MGNLEFGILILFFGGTTYLLFSISLTLEKIKRELQSKNNVDLYSIESRLDSICDEVEEINFYRNFPDGNFFEHKRKIKEEIRNPDSFHKLTKIEDELKKTRES
jgi:hypothetical protein